jgi:hypothetical protein
MKFWRALMSLIFHFLASHISRRRYVLSSLTLALSSLVLWLALPQGGAPLVILLVGLPVAASLWMLGSARRLNTTLAQDL